VAEEVAAKRVVAEILYHGAAVRVSAGTGHLVWRGARKATRQQGPETGVPQGVDVRLVRQHRIRGRVSRCAPDGEKNEDRGSHGSSQLSLPARPGAAHVHMN